MHFPALLLCIMLLPTILALSPVVDIGYTSYRGIALNNGITQWLGMRYAAPPLGDLRFREPHDPLPKPYISDAHSFGRFCLGTEQGPPTDQMDEDCLFLNVWAPSAASEMSKLPVYFFIQGGGFNTNALSNNGSGLVIASEMSIVVVNFSYRTVLHSVPISAQLTCPQVSVRTVSWLAKKSWQMAA